VVDGAEVVRDAVLAAVSYEEDVDVAELAAAVGAGPRSACGSGGLVHLPGLPVGSLDRPRDNVLEATEHSPAIARRLIQAEPVVFLDLRPAPGATFGCHTPK